MERVLENLSQAHARLQKGAARLSENASRLAIYNSVPSQVEDATNMARAAADAVQDANLAIEELLPSEDDPEPDAAADADPDQTPEPPGPGV